MTYIFAYYLREGSSDDGLLKIIYATLIDCGFSSDSFITPLPYPTGTKTLTSGLNAILKLGDIPVFIHRDSDNESRDKRIQEIKNARSSTGFTALTIPVIPVRETEAWLLYALHNSDFRQRVGVPESIALPSRQTCETIAAKEKLKEIYNSVINQFPSKRRSKNAENFAKVRSRWLEALDDIKFVEGCQSFEDFRKECINAYKNKNS